MHLKISSAKWRPFCPGGDELMRGQAWHVMTWKRFPRCGPVFWGTHRSPVDSPHKGPVMWSFDIFFVVSSKNCWANSLNADDLRRHSDHYSWFPLSRVIVTYALFIRALSIIATTNSSNVIPPDSSRSRLPNIDCNKKVFNYTTTPWNTRTA